MTHFVSGPFIFLDLKDFSVNKRCRLPTCVTCNKGSRTMHNLDLCHLFCPKTYFCSLGDTFLTLWAHEPSYLLENGCFRDVHNVLLGYKQTFPLNFCRVRFILSFSWTHYTDINNTRRRKRGNKVVVRTRSHPHNAIIKYLMLHTPDGNTFLYRFLSFKIAFLLCISGRFHLCQKLCDARRNQGFSWNNLMEP